MQFSEAWLREWVNPNIDTDQLISQLTMAGLEVDSVSPVSGEFSGVIVGEVIDCQPHPDAERLSVCQVAVGSNQALQIVCGANNVATGVLIPTAIEGAVLPGDFKIKSTKLRGVDSFGMLCAASELGLAEQSDGLLILPADAPVGQDINEYLQLNDSIIEVDLTPNRADCLSVVGIARELALLNQMAIQQPTINAVELASEETIQVSVEAPDACPRYLARAINNVNAFAETPLWMQERLRRSGIRSLGAVVDITNYVLLEYGQPLHAFDRSKVRGEIQVRYAHQDEKLMLLNDQEISLTEQSLVIADEDKALALAGIMGGLDSSVTESTTDILLECAFFSPKVLMGKARNYGLHTDSSHRFERGVDSELQLMALEHATQLIVSIAGGQVGPVQHYQAAEHLPQAPTILLRRERLQRMLGYQFSDQQVTDILSGLGMSIDSVTDGWQVVAPSFRFDIAIEADLIEEVARIFGYDQLPKRQMMMPVSLLETSEQLLPVDRIKDLLVDRGYQEAITFSFGDNALHQQFEPDVRGLALKNPISSELSEMRTSLWPGLMLAAQHNLNRQQERIRLFETGLKFHVENDVIIQSQVLAGLAFGASQPGNSHEKSRELDFYDIKSDLQAIFNCNRSVVTFAAGKHPVLHPGQTAVILAEDGRQLGVFGMLHPEMEKGLGVASGMFFFELDLQTILQRQVPKFEPLSKFPQVRRDLSVSVAEDIPAGALVEIILETEPKLINSVTIFDVYHGKGVESGHKSVALGMILQDKSKTLTDTEIDAIVSRVIEKLSAKYGARLRD